MSKIRTYAIWGLLVPAVLVYFGWTNGNNFILYIIAVLLVWGTLSAATKQFKKSTAAPHGVCPECRTAGALSSFKGPRCPNPSCSHYDSTLALGGFTEAPAPSMRSNFEGNFDPGADSLRIQYRNYLGQDRVFTGDSKSVRKGKNSFSVRVTPTGKRIRFKKKFVRNAEELERLAKPKDGDGGAVPMGTERQVLSYHIKKGSTSPRFEELRKKFPTWDPR